MILGAGAAGLAAARTLDARGVDLLLLEAGTAPGGVMQTVEREGYQFERGPNTLRMSGPALAVLREAGVEAELLRASPASRRRFLLRDGRLEPVPMDPWSFLRSPLLGMRAKLGLLAEPLRRRGDGSRESVAEFLGRRLGDEVVEALVGPFLVGVYAGDERELGAQAVFPSLVAYERRAGSILLGALRAGLRRDAPRGLSGTWSGARGLGGLAAALARSLGERLRLSTTARALVRERRGWRVETEAGTLRARRVVVALPAPAAAALLEKVCPEAARVAAAVDYAPMVSLPLALDPAALRVRPEGFGFLVPREEGLELLGALFMSQLFPGRAPAGRELVMAMIGGRRWPAAVEASDQALLGRVSAALDRVLGLRGEPEALDVVRWERAVPQPGVEHPRRVAAARAALSAASGGGTLELAGAWVDGVSVADALGSGRAAAQRLLAAE